MRKTITRAMLSIALLASIDMYAQAPPGQPGPPVPNGPGAPVPPGPGGPPTGRRGPGGSLQPVAAFQGRVMRLTTNDDYIYDGFYLQMSQDSILVKFPGHLGAQMTPLLKAGATVTVNGMLEYPPFGGKDISLVSLSINGKTVYDTPPPAPAAPPEETFVSGNAKIVSIQIDREGRMNGLLLDNRTVLRIPPDIAGQLADLAKNGLQVDYSGMQKTPQSGEVAAIDRKIVHCNTISVNGQQFLVR